MSKLTSNFGSHTLFDQPKRYVSTGILALDHIISGKYDGTGGIPLGWIVELAGKSQTGKSLVSYKMAVEFQKKGGYVFINDAENSYYPDKAEALGMDHKPIKDGGHFYYNTLEMIEDFFTKTAKFCEDVNEVDPDAPILIVLDSLGVMMTKEENETGIQYEDMGRRAKRNKEGARQILPVLNRCGATLAVANHLYDTLAMMGPKQVSGGGMALDYTTNLRIFFLQTKQYPDKKNPEGVIMKARIVKNRMNFAAEGKACEFGVDWEQGPLKYTGLLPLLVSEIEGLEHAGGWFKYRGHSFRSSDFASNPENYFKMFKDGEKDAEDDEARGVLIDGEDDANDDA